jgi:hypothetical protein
VDDETRAAIDRVDAAIGKVESLVKTLAQDVGDLRRKSESHEAALQRVLDAVGDGRKETDVALRSFANAQASMASAVTQAVAQLTLAQSLEKRVDRFDASNSSTSNGGYPASSRGNFT